MNTETNDGRFTHLVKGSGAARGMSITGRRRLLAGPPAAADVPLVIALHGGTYTSTYFDIPGYSLLDRAAALRSSYRGDRPSRLRRKHSARP